MWRKRKKESSRGNGLFPASGKIAKERLKLILDAEKQKLDEDTLNQIKQEIGSVITKYVDIEPENIEVKVLLKDYKKKESYLYAKTV